MYMWLSNVSAVMVSGSGSLVAFALPRVEGDPGEFNVADDEETESSTPSRAGEGGREGDSSMGGRSGLISFLDLML